MAERNFKGVWIPKEIWLAKDLGWSEKVLLVEIDSLDGEQGCFASNEYLADFFKLSKDRISKMISSLRDKGYITVQLVYKEGTKQIEKRIIRLVRQPYPIGENTDTPSRKQREGLGGNTDTPIGENAKDNNTVFNNTTNNTKDSQTDSPLINPNFEPIKQLFESKVRIATLADCNNIHEALEFYEPQLINEAILTGANSARSFKYILSILDNWRKELGVKTYADWQVKIDATTKRSNGGNHGQAQSQKPSIFGNYCSE